MARYFRDWEMKYTFWPKGDTFGYGISMDNTPVMLKGKHSKAHLKTLEVQLHLFEEKYSMSSDRFFSLYRKGEMGAIEEFDTWAELFVEYLYWKRQV
jgi:hypothetical protein